MFLDAAKIKISFVKYCFPLIFFVLSETPYVILGCFSVSPNGQAQKNGSQYEQ